MGSLEDGLPEAMCEWGADCLAGDRCFLFLVNYARMKPDMAQSALPTLIAVCVHIVIVRRT